MVIEAAKARKVLAVIRLVNGGLALLAPQFLLRRLGTDPDRDPSGIYPFRMFGIRTILIGADLLLLTGEQSRRASKMAVVIHASDTASAVPLASEISVLVRRSSAPSTTLATSPMRIGVPFRTATGMSANDAGSTMRPVTRTSRSVAPRSMRPAGTS